MKLNDIVSKLHKNDLKYHAQYDWTVVGNDDSNVTGKPDSTLLNKREGYEVLNFINKLAKEKNWTKKEALKAEDMIYRELPSDIRSQKHVVNWIEANW